MSHALQFSDLTKSFGGARALDSVDFTVDYGEVHGLLGENGSGKSTLIKVLAGYHVPEAGALRVGEKNIELPLRPGQTKELNLSFVHQDLGLIPSLDVVDNLFLTQQESSTRPWFISWGQQRRKAREIFDRYGIDIKPRAVVGELSPVQRALLAIVRAVEDMRGDQAGSGRRGILVLDEPTVYLPKNEINQLFELVRSIAAEGSSIIFVSHDLDEALEITDRITVLRDGHVVGTVVSDDTTPAQLVEMIIGRTLESLHATEGVVSMKPVRAAISGLAGGLLNDVSFDAHEGEVLGLTGLAGSGFELVPYFLYGARTAVAGELTHAGATHDLTQVTPADSLAHDIALFPADRLEDGCVGSLPVSDNLALPILGSYFENLRLNRRRMIKDADGLLETYDVRPRKPRMAYGQLSGGNQQKAMMARGLRTTPTLLLLHEPTQGVDIGARQNIFELIRAAATDDATVICASSDYEQLALICDRVLIFAGGEVVASLVGSEITKDRILEQCFRTAVGAGDNG